MRSAAGCQPRCSSIMAPARMTAPGFTLSWPAYFGAVPWVASKSAVGVREYVLLVVPGEDLLEHATRDPILDHHHPLRGLALVLAPEIVLRDRDVGEFLSRQ